MELEETKKVEPDGKLKPVRPRRTFLVVFEGKPGKEEQLPDIDSVSAALYALEKEHGDFYRVALKCGVEDEKVAAILDGDWSKACKECGASNCPHRLP